MTLQDLEAVAKGRPLPTYHALVMFSRDLEDEAFGWHLIQRMESLGLNVS